MADAEFAVDVHVGVDFFAAVTVGFEAVAGFEEFELGGVPRVLGRGHGVGLFLGGLFCRFLGRLLGEGEADAKCDEEQQRKDSEEERRTPRDLHGAHEKQCRAAARARKDLAVSALPDMYRMASTGWQRRRERITLRRRVR